MPSDALLDLVIAVHDASRPIRRAVESVLESGAGGGVRVTVVCHGIPSAIVAKQLEGLESDQLRVVEFDDGVASPAGPFNFGLSISEAEYIAIMGSDDFLETGAMGTWLSWIREKSPDVLMVRLRYQDGEKLRIPLTRPWRQRALDPVRDRLFYQTAPLGLIRRKLIGERELQLTPDLPVGSDMNFSARLWTSGARIDHAHNAPCYVIGSDAQTRVTTTVRPVRETAAPINDLFGREWLQTLPRSHRAALVTKNLRIHLFGIIAARPTPDLWTLADFEELVATARRVVAAEPRGMRPLCRADRAVLDDIANPASSVASVLEAWHARTRASRFALLLPRNPLYTFHRESTLTRYLLYRIAS